MKQQKSVESQSVKIERVTGNEIQHYQLAKAYMKSGDLEQAKRYLFRTIECSPDDALIYTDLGLCFLAGHEAVEAIQYFDEAIRIDSQCKLAFQNKAEALITCKRYEDALESLEQAIQLEPDNTDLDIGKGNLLLKLDRFEEAIAVFTHAVDRDPESLSLQHNLAIALLGEKRYDEALESLACSIKNQPNADSFWIKGRVYLETGDPEKALIAFNQSALLNPSHPFLFVDKANCHLCLKQYDLAYESIQLAIKYALDNDGVVYHNIAHALHRLNRFDEAFVGYDIALEFDASNPDMLWNRSLLLISTGQYEEGWALFEKRIHTKSLRDNYYKFEGKDWRGEFEITGKKLLIYSEQGLGDVIQFSRYIGLLKKFGAEVLFEVPAALYSVIATLDADMTLFKRGTEIPDFDFCCPLMSLPYVVKTSLDTIPSETPYLYAEDSQVAKWKAQLKDSPLPKVGIVWSGQKLHKNDINRSVSLDLLLPLFGLPFEWHSLQKEYRSSDLEVLNLYPEINQHQSELHDFSDTAALIECMDIVISVDTSVAHLAAAMNKPVWILLPVVPDYRWLLDRDDSPWYPSVKLFRQTQLGEWSHVVKRLERALIEYSNQSAPNGFDHSGNNAGQVEARSFQIKALQAQSSGDFSEAIRLYKQAVAIQPDCLGSWRGLAQLYLTTNQMLDAFDTIVPLVEKYPEDILLRQLFGRLCLRLQDFSLAESQFKLVLDELPDSLSAFAGLLDVYLAKNDLVAAKDVSLQMLSINPNSEVALMATATLCAANGQYVEELELLNKLVELSPDNKTHRYNRSRAFLRQGKYGLGWEEYEYRFGTILPRSTLQLPVWQGEAVATLVVVAEQGLGDTVMFSRFLELAKLNAKTVVFACQPELVAVMEQSLSVPVMNVEEIWSLKADAQCFLLSLPHILRLDKPELFGCQTFLKAQEDRLAYWSEVIHSAKSQIKMGVAFASSVAHSTEFCPSFRRSCDPGFFADLNTLPNVTLFNLQFGQDNPFPEHWINAQALIRDFEDTVALIDQLDLVITVDTVIAHLAGGLNKPCVLLLPYAADWRWMTETVVTDWYPSVFLFRQNSPGNWLSAVSAAKNFIQNAYNI